MITHSFATRFVRRSLIRKLAPGSVITFYVDLDCASLEFTTSKLRRAIEQVQEHLPRTPATAKRGVRSFLSVHLNVNDLVVAFASDTHLVSLYFAGVSSDLSGCDGALTGRASSRVSLKHWNDISSRSDAIVSETVFSAFLCSAPLDTTVEMQADEDMHLNITTEACAAVGAFLDCYSGRGPRQVTVRRMYERGIKEEAEGNARVEIFVQSREVEEVWDGKRWVARRTGGKTTLPKANSFNWEIADSEWITDRSWEEADGVRRRKQTLTRFKVVRWWSSLHEKILSTPSSSLLSSLHHHRGALWFKSGGSPQRVELVLPVRSVGEESTLSLKNLTSSLQSIVTHYALSTQTSTLDLPPHTLTYLPFYEASNTLAIEIAGLKFCV